MHSLFKTKRKVLFKKSFIATIVYGNIWHCFITIPWYRGKQGIVH